MPVFLVSVNANDEGGRPHPVPELLGLVTGQPTPAAAVAWTCANEVIALRDIDVAVLSARNDCWYQEGPELAQ